VPTLAADAPELETTLIVNGKAKDFVLGIFCLEYADRLRIQKRQVTCNRRNVNGAIYVDIKVRGQNLNELDMFKRLTPSDGFQLPSFEVAGIVGFIGTQSEKEQEAEKALAGANAIMADPLNMENAKHRTIFLLTSGLACVFFLGMIFAHIADKQKDRLFVSGAPFTGGFILSEMMWTGAFLRNPASRYRSKERWFGLCLYLLMCIAVLAFRVAHGDTNYLTMLWMVVGANVPVKLLEMVLRRTSVGEKLSQKVMAANEVEFDQDSEEASDEFLDEVELDSEEDPLPPPGGPPPPPPPVGGPPIRGQNKSPKEQDAEHALKLIAAHADDTANQQRSFANERARQLASLAEKVASRPGSSVRPHSQQEKDQATASAVVAAHQATSFVQRMEHENERERQLAKLTLAVQSRPSSSAQTQPMTPRSSSAPSAWGDEPMSPSPMYDNEEEWVMTKASGDVGLLPMSARYFAWFMSFAVTGGLLFFLYLQLPQTGALSVSESAIPVGICVGASLFLLEPLCLFIIWKSRKASSLKSAHLSSGADAQNLDESVEGF